MRGVIIASAFAMTMIAGPTWALPQGPGGTLWLSLSRADAGDNIDILYVDIDANWNPVNAAPAGAVTVITGLPDWVYVNYFSYSLRTGMTSLWTDGTPVVACYYDQDVYVEGSVSYQLMDVLNIKKDGSLTVLHDGSRNGAEDQPHTMGASTAVVDEDRQFGTAPGEANPALYIGGANNYYADSVWHDTDADGNYDEFANAKRCGSFNFDADAELVGNKLYMHTYDRIERIVFDSSDNSYTDAGTAKNFFQEFFPWSIGVEGKIAVGDTDGDGLDDVYFFDDDDRLLVGSDLDGNDRMGSGEIRYANPTTTTFSGIPGDIELFETDNGSWVLMHVTSYEGYEANKGSRIEIWSLLDNGDLNENDYKQIIYWHARTAQGDNSFSLVNSSNVDYPHMEFAPLLVVPNIPGDANNDGKVDSTDLGIWQQNYDPIGNVNNTFAMGDFDGDTKIDSSDLGIWQQNYDPIGSSGAGMGTQVPEPATLLLVGSGLLGGLGVIRRRRTK